jgi:hypothetical protein
MSDRRTKQVLELIEKISDAEMYESLPSDEKKYAKRMLQNVEDAIEKNDASAAAFFMLEWAESFYGDVIRAGEKARKRKVSSVQRLNWLLQARSLRVRYPKISTLKIAKTIAPDHVRLARLFLSQCEKANKLNKKLA